MHRPFREQPRAIVHRCVRWQNTGYAKRARVRVLICERTGLRTLNLAKMQAHIPANESTTSHLRFVTELHMQVLIVTSKCMQSRLITVREVGARGSSKHSRATLCYYKSARVPWISWVWPSAIKNQDSLRSVHLL